MTLARRLIILALLVPLVAIGWTFVSFKRDPSAGANERPPLDGIQIVDGYKQWKRVNPVPAIMQSAVSTLCAPISQQSRMDLDNPHRDKFITVYVNDTGRHAMMEEKVPRFPQNSVIVKEKLTTRSSTSPELLTVMIKRETGYDAENGDWEYMVLDGSAKSVKERGKLPACQSCHTMVKSTDYVSRSYLPGEVRQQLK